MKHCCERMACDLNQKCDLHPDRYNCPDNLIAYGAKTGEYGLIVHDGGGSVVRISFCPWCGQRLRKQRRNKARGRSSGQARK